MNVSESKKLQFNQRIPTLLFNENLSVTIAPFRCVSVYIQYYSVCCSVLSLSSDNFKHWQCTSEKHQILKVVKNVCNSK